jgi:hypothetical protein
LLSHLGSRSRRSQIYAHLTRPVYTGTTDFSLYGHLRTFLHFPRIPGKSACPRSRESRAAAPDKNVPTLDRSLALLHYLLRPPGGVIRQMQIRNEYLWLHSCFRVRGGSEHRPWRFVINIYCDNCRLSTSNLGLLLGEREQNIYIVLAEY